jgi:alpha-2-macroglobulin
VWTLSAAEQAGAKPANDTLKFTQKITAAVPVVAWAVTLLRPEQPLTLPVQAPAGAILSRGGVRATFASSIVGSLDPVRAWFERYPYFCLEQRTSKAVGLRDAALWKQVSDSLPNYLDADGLAAYFPGESRATGSDVLTAYVLATAHESGWEVPEASRERMLAGLTAFVEGKLKRDMWSPQRDDVARRIGAIEVLSRYGRATAPMLGTVDAAPNAWPTSALIDWISILQRVPAREQAKLLADATQVLRNRLSFSGTRIVFADEKADHWWWLMVNSDVNAAKLLLAALDNKLGIAEWLQDMPRLVNGLVARQQRGVWQTTTANLWGSLALEKYAAKFERDPVAGSTSLAVDASTQSTQWKAGVADALNAPWSKEGKAQATVTHNGSGKPYVTLQAMAAVPEAPQTNAGYRVVKTVTPVSQKAAGTWARGDTYRVDIEIVANAPMTWVALSDPVPAGSTVLGSGLRDSQAEQVKSDSAAPKTGGDRWSWAWLAYEERGFEGYRAYYEYLPKGSTKLSYTVRLNQAGEFALPATRAEAMYAPEVFGSTPNAKWTILK